MIFAASCDAPVVLKLLIGHELNGAMADAEERGYQTSVEARQAFGGPEVGGTVTDRLIGSRSSFCGRQHACLDDPDWICEDGSEDAGSSRGQEVVQRGQLLLVRTAVGFDEVLDVAIPGRGVRWKFAPVGLGTGIHTT